ncbi:unnamed protein product [Bursaphelenchus okinawaensis]|uniref:Major facilitator superfamily (MFS) profile domain-containing protein n=1 Tax=Bursaphelenchus okinawaensis TaxID=465554 RepID=A0A811KKA0_9BILA|nr:unnamed protein product [Bursaphelenchus okinawaensis]CAG9104737.1 unnamed protein product [Bursaphelenchus okinawaensis]
MSVSNTMTVLLIVLVVDLFCFTSILPLFPSILEEYSKNKDNDWLYNKFEQHASFLQSLINIPVSSRYNNVFFAGVLGSIFSFLQYLSSPILGSLSDSYGRKTILLISVIGSLVSYIIWAFSTNFTLFTLSRIVGGLSKASVSIAITIVTDICSPETRGKGMACVGMCFSLAFMAGPMIGAYFSNSFVGGNINFYPAIFSVTLTIVELLLIWFCLPETNNVTTRKAVAGSWVDYINPRSLITFKTLGPKLSSELALYGIVYFLYLFIYSGCEFTISFLTHLRFGYTSANQGKMYFVTGVLMMVIQGGFVRRIPKDKQTHGAMFGLLAIIPTYIIMSFAYNQVVFYISLVLYAVASSVVVPCFTSLVANICSEEQKGLCMGIFRSLGALSRAFGPLSGSILFWLLGPTAAYFVSGVLLCVPAVLFYKTIVIGHKKAV